MTNKILKEASIIQILLLRDDYFLQIPLQNNKTFYKNITVQSFAEQYHLLYITTAKRMK